MVISEVKRIAQLAFVDNAVLYGFISGKELLQIVITNIAYVSSVNIVVAGAASVAASAELARCGLGKANSITTRAWRAMVGAMPTAGNRHRLQRSEEQLPAGGRQFSAGSLRVPVSGTIAGTLPRKLAVSS